MTKSNQAEESIKHSIRKNGFPEKIVRLPFKPVYDACKEHGTSLSDVLDHLQDQQIFGKIIDLPLSTLQNQSDQIRKLTQNLGQVRSTIISKILGSISDIVSVIFFVPILFFYSPLLGTVVLAFCALGSSITILHSRGHKVLAGATSTADVKRQNLLKTTVDGFEDIKKLGLESELYKL